MTVQRIPSAVCQQKQIADGVPALNAILAPYEGPPEAQNCLMSIPRLEDAEISHF